LFTPILLSIPAISFFIIKSDIESYYSPSIRTEFFAARIFLSFAICYLYETQNTQKAVKLLQEWHLKTR